MKLRSIDFMEQGAEAPCLMQPHIELVIEWVSHEKQEGCSYRFPFILHLFPMLPQPNKNHLRRSLLSIRQALPPDQWRQHSDQICTHLRDWPTFQQAKTVLAYFSFRQEPDLSALFTLPKKWGFPRCVGKEMTWHHWSPAEAELTTSYPIQTGAYGILEPHPDAPRIHPNDVDLILVPAVACDPQGYRLGYGSGFYDRMLSLPAWARKSTIGIVFQEARLLHLPHDLWDKPLQAICTEAGVSLSH